MKINDILDIVDNAVYPNIKSLLKDVRYLISLAEVKIDLGIWLNIYFDDMNTKFRYIISPETVTNDEQFETVERVANIDLPNKEVLVDSVHLLGNSSSNMTEYPSGDYINITVDLLNVYP